MYKLYWRLLFRPHLGKITLLVGIIAGHSLFELLGIALTIPFMALIVESTDTRAESALRAFSNIAEQVGLGTDESVLLPAIGVLVLIIVVLNGGLRLLTTFLTTRISGSVSVDLLTRMFDRFLSAPYQEVAQRGRAGVNQDMGSSGPVSRLVSLVSDAISSLMLLLALSGLLLFLSWQTTLIAVSVFVPMTVLIRRIFDRPSREISTQLYELGKRRTLTIFDAIDGIRVSKMQGLRQHHVWELRSNGANLVRAQVKVAVIGAVPGTVNEIVGMSVVLFLLFLTFYVPQLGMSLPIIVAMVLALRRISPAVTRLGSMLLQVSATYKQITVVDEVLHDMAQEDEGGKDLPPSVKIDTISLRSVSFAYPERPSKLALDNISLDLRRGQGPRAHAGG